MHHKRVLLVILQHGPLISNVGKKSKTGKRDLCD